MESNKNIVIVPCVALQSKDFGTDYTKWEALVEIGKNSWDSAVRNVVGADEVILFHSKLKVKSHQQMERMILRKCITLHKQGFNILLLEADTLCIQEVDIFSLDLKELQLFSLAGTEDHPSIPGEYNLNSGVVYWPALATKPCDVLIEELAGEWPDTWAYYQNIWNKAYYSQFSTFEAGLEKLSFLGNGKYNWFYGKTKNQIQIKNAVIAHFFTSRGLIRANKLSNITRRFGIRGFEIAFRFYNSALFLAIQNFKIKLISKIGLSR